MRSALAIRPAPANRRHPLFGGVIGMFVNTVVVRCNLTGDPTLRETLYRVSRVLLEAYENQEMSFDKVVENLNPERVSGLNPFFQTLFSFHDSKFNGVELNGITLEAVEVLSRSAAKCDLSIIVIPNNRARSRIDSGSEVDDVEVIWEYSTDLFEEPTIERMIGHYVIMSSILRRSRKDRWSMISQRSVGEVVFGRRFLLVAICIAAVAGPVVFGLVTAPGIPAQSSTVSAALSFEVASIKLSRPGGNRRSVGFRPDRFETIGTTAKSLIQFAYHLESSSQVSGGPNWINSEEYDIDAKPGDLQVEELQKLPVDQQADRVRLMVQSLLADRFKLKVNHATKELPVYALVVLKNGPKLAPGTAGPKGSRISGSRGSLRGTSAPISLLVHTLAPLPELDGRVILDETGLEGRYDFLLQWTPENMAPLSTGTAGSSPLLAQAPPPDSSGPSIFTAIQEQLGLKLESTKAPIDTIIIEHSERPTEN